MPSLRKLFEQNMDRARFVTQQEKEGIRKKPKKQRDPDYSRPVSYGTVLKRDIRLLIRLAAINQQQMDMTYQKITTKETKHYICCPYSYRYRFLRLGRTKMLFAYDVDDKHIKGFVVKNIRKVKILDKRFRARWGIEIFTIMIAVGLSILA